jgi:hypothetical protein
MANANYSGIQGSGAAKLAAYAIEKSLSKTWVNTLARTSPLLAKIMDEGRFNKGGEVRGQKFILPIITGEGDIQFAGVTDANQFTALTPTLTTGDSQAEYEYAHYRGAYHLTHAEIQLLTAPEGTARGNILNAKKAKMESVVSKLLATNTAGTQAGSRTAHSGILGIVTSTDQVVAGVDQATTTAWRPTRKAGGYVGLTDVDALIDLVEDGPTTKGAIDLIVCSKAVSSGPNVLNAFRSLIAANEMIVNNNASLAKYGFRDFEYAGIQVIGDSFIPNGASQGRMVGLSTKNWYAVGSKVPIMHEVSRLPGTDGFEHFFTQWMGLGCANVGANFIWSGIVG